MKREIRLAAGCFSWPTITFSATQWFDPVGAQCAIFIFICSIGVCNTTRGKSSSGERSRFPAARKKHPHAGRFRNRGKVHSAALFSASKHTGVKWKRNGATYFRETYSSKWWPKTNPGNWLPRRKHNAALHVRRRGYRGSKRAALERRRRHTRLPLRWQAQKAAVGRLFSTDALYRWIDQSA